MAALLALLPAVGHDQLWCLYVADRMLAGTKLYGPEILESNPPLIMGLMLLPAGLSHLLHLPATALFKVGVLLVEAASAAVSLHLLRRLCPGLSRATLWSLAFAFVAIFAAMPARDFGQRDHLLAILCLPYVVAAALDLSSRSGPDPNPSGQHPSRVVPLQDTPSPLIRRTAAPGDPATIAGALGPTARRPTLSLTAGTLIGITAGIGIALKPHHLLIPVTIELALTLGNPALRTRNHGTRSTRTLRNLLRPLARPEPWAILLTSLAYLLAIRLLTPAYLTVILPILRDTYWAIGHLTLPLLVAESPQLHLLLVATACLTLLNHRSRPSPSHSLQDPGTSTSLPATGNPGSPVRPDNLRSLADLLLLAGLASTVAFYLQGTGWYYQQLPALSFLALSLWFNLIDLLTRRPLPIPTWLPGAITALSLLAVALTAHFSGYPFTSDRSFPITSPDPTFFTNLPPDTPVAILSTAVDDTIPPLFRYHLLWAQRTNNLWILPAILRSEDAQASQASNPTPIPTHPIPPDRLAALDQAQHRFMAEDLARWHPALILIARCQDPAVHCQVLEDRHDNLLAWFSRDPAFRQTFSQYHYLRSSGIYDAYIPN